VNINNIKSGFIGGLLIVVGAILCLVLVGYLAQRLDDTYYDGTFINNNDDTTNIVNQNNNQEIIETNCGLIIESPLENSIVYSPMTVSGYVNGCGWQLVNGSIGTVALYDATEGGLISEETNLSVLSTSSGKTYFSATLSYPDTTSNLSGYLYFKHSGGVETMSLPIKY